MKYDIFISHSSENEDQVKALCSYLENKDLKCFVSYRDIPGGASYPGAITRAMRESEMVLLVLSSNSKESSQVDREVKLANDEKKKLSCFRLEDVAYSDDQAYVMSGVNWLNAFPSPEEHYFELLQDLCRQLGKEVPKQEETEEARLERYKQKLGEMLYEASNGDSEAQYNLGRIYDQGLFGLKEDKEEAFRWNLKAAKKGHIGAENDVGVYYATGTCVDKNEAEAFKWYRLAALHGNDAAQYNLAWRYYNGTFVDEDQTQAVKWWKLAAGQGYDPALLELGNCYYYGEGVEQSYEQAMEYYTQAAALDNEKAKIRLAECYRDGHGVEANIEKCIEILKQIAVNNSTNSTNAMVDLAQLYEEGQLIEPDYPQAFDYIKQAADKGNRVALYNLARFYKNGIGCEKNLRMWYEYLQKAANKGHCKAQYYLGKVYNNGVSEIGVNPDPEKALNWYQKAIEQDNTSAMVDLGLCYSNGGCLPLNDAKAAELFRQAAEADDAGGQFFLADEYQQGDGVEQNDEEAFKWMTKSAKQDFVPALARLGEYYFYGIGTEQDFNKAVEMLTKAANKGFSDAQYLLGMCYEFGYGVEKSVNSALDNYYLAGSQQADISFERIIAKLEKNPIKEEDTVSMYGLGIYYIYRKIDHKQALQYLLKAAQSNNLNSTSILLANKFISICYRELGNHEKALEYAQKALELGIQEFGEQHLEVARCHNSIALACRKLNRLDEALQHFQAALEIRKPLLPSDDEDIKKSEKYIQETLNDMQKKSE